MQDQPSYPMHQCHGAGESPTELETALTSVLSCVKLFLSQSQHEQEKLEDFSVVSNNSLRTIKDEAQSGSAIAVFQVYLSKGFRPVMSSSMTTPKL